MATTTGKSAPRRAKPAGGAGRAGPSGKSKAGAAVPSTKKRASARGSRPRARSSARRPTPRRPASSPRKGFRLPGLGGHGPDLAGLALVTLGVVAAFGIYGDLAGPAGRSLERAAAGAVGGGRLVVPPALVAIGCVVVVRRPRENGLRLVLASVMLTLAGAGLLHLASGSPAWGSPLAELRGAGGVVGAAAAEPLRALLATGGAAVVLVALGGAGIMVVAHAEARDLGARAGRTGRVMGAGLVRVVRAVSGWGTGLSPVATPEDHSADNGPAHAATVPVLTNPDAELLSPDDNATEPEEVVPAGEHPDGDTATADEESAVLVHVPTGDAPSGEQLSIDLGPAAAPEVWRLPSLRSLKRGATAEVDRKLVEAEGRALESALAAHGVDTRLVGMTVGPTVTRFELALGPGVKVARVTNLHKDIAYAMASPDVRILAPIPGRSAIGVEVPNKVRQLVLLGDILTSTEAQRASHPLEVAMGRDIAGRAVMVNLAEMPHVLIAGATGAGKSSCINSLVTSLLVRATPDQVRLILVDPKRVELGHYNGLPHLLTQVVVNPKRAANALSWAVHEMERRYDLLAEVGARDITGYNAAYDRGDLQAAPGVETTYTRLPFIVIVVDELNDLMMVAARDVEESICRIAQMARAVGIHLVIATQRPSVDVITGVIKANVPSRIAFAVSSLADSRVILDQQGAERLVGQGDMLLAVAASNVPRRVQGAWVGEDEVRKVVAHWRRQAQPSYVEGVEGDEPTRGGGAVDDDDDELLETAMELVVRSQLGSTSMLQRKLRVGFARAGRLMDLLERRGVVGPSEGSKPRAVLMTSEELDERLQRDG